ncbi:MAG: glycosyltransferase family 2 protein [Methylacidiphilales bacterium]|nr:glycosyltransferase family 2 protein [Candidatus Methylacidiphilales bacterium]
MSTSSQPSLSVCIPSYNEEATIESAVAQIEAVLDKLPGDYEILVCDDGSSDRSGEIIRRMAAADPRLRPIFHPTNKGIRATFEELYASATKEAVFLIPSDLEWPPEILPVLIASFGEADIVIAGRTNKNYGPFRSLVSHIFNLVPLALFGVRTNDAGAVKLVRREIIERVNILSSSPFSEAERIVRAVRLGYRVKLVPTVTRQRRAGISHGVRLKVLIEAVSDVCRVWWDIRILGH